MKTTKRKMLHRPRLSVDNFVRVRNGVWMPKDLSVVLRRARIGKIKKLLPGGAMVSFPYYSSEIYYYNNELQRCNSK